MEQRTRRVCSGQEVEGAGEMIDTITPLPPRIIIPESVHLYTAYGEPVEMVPLAKPMRRVVCECGANWDTPATTKTKCDGCERQIDVATATVSVRTLRDADAKDMKAHGLLRSVSHIAKYGEYSGALDNYKRNLWADLTIRCYAPGLENDHAAWKARVVEASGDAEEEATTRGTAMHTAIGKALAGDDYGEVDESTAKAVENVLAWAAGCGERKIERAFASTDYFVAGTVDFDGAWLGKVRRVADWKTTNHKAFEGIKKSGKPRTAHIKQVVGYAKCTSSADYAEEQCYVVYISQATGEMLPIRVTEEQERWAWLAFRTAIPACYANDGYDPAQMWRDGKCKRLADILAK